MNVLSQPLTLLSLLPAGVFAFIVFIKVFPLLRGKRDPLKDSLLRSPGESLSRQMEKIDESLNLYIFAVVAFSMMTFLLIDHKHSAFSTGSGLSISFVVYLAIFVVAAAFFAISFSKKFTRRRNLSLGFRGERAVGEELNKLMFDGCHVFHDLPGDGDWNVDHVVVAPSGVYAVETKTRRKSASSNGKRDYEVVYDGKFLEYPHGKDSHGVEQAKKSARWLSRFLTNAIQEDVHVTPILALPGWLVSSRVKSNGLDLRVLSHKQIRPVILGYGETILNRKRMGQIAHQLELRCRDVAF